MTPRKDGVLQFSGKVEAGEPLEKYREAARLAAGNALTAARNRLEAGEKNLARPIGRPSTSTRAKASAPHSKIADFASEYLCEELGEAGTAARAAVGRRGPPPAKLPWKFR